MLFLWAHNAIFGIFFQTLNLIFNIVFICCVFSVYVSVVEAETQVTYFHFPFSVLHCSFNVD